MLPAVRHDVPPDIIPARAYGADVRGIDDAQAALSDAARHGLDVIKQLPVLDALWFNKRHGQEITKGRDPWRWRLRPGADLLGWRIAPDFSPLRGRGYAR